MYYHEGARLIYLAHPRTASVATAYTLQNKLGFRKVTPGDHHSQLWFKSKGKPFNGNDRDQWTVFTTVRNHWDTAVSWRFKKRYLRDSKIRRWDAGMWRLLFEDNNWIQRHRMWWLHADDADVILRYENLERGLRDFLSGHSLFMGELARENVSHERAGAPYHEFFSKSGEQYIWDRFGEEIERFGYFFNGGVGK